jgi:hypothetical protein
VRGRARWARLTPRRATQYYADKAEALDGGGSSVDVALPDDRFTCRVVKEPLGVVGLITPWNYPLLCVHAASVRGLREARLSAAPNAQDGDVEGCACASCGLRRGAEAIGERVADVPGAG